MPFPTERPPDMETLEKKQYFPLKPMAKEPENHYFAKENHLPKFPNIHFYPFFGAHSI